MRDNVNVIVLAAGKGTRMVSAKSKVLHEVGGLSLLGHCLKTGAALSAARTVIITGHEAESVEAAAGRLAPGAMFARQEPQLGTAHAVAQARAAMAGAEGDALILYADTPLIRPETLRRMGEARAAGAAVVVLGFEAADPGGYGRLKLAPDGSLEAIVEAKDAAPEERAIRLCNSGVMRLEAGLLFKLLERVDNKNAKGEYYLTDIVGLARKAGLRCAAVNCDEAEVLGVNSRIDLAAAEAAFQARARAAAMTAGATLIAPETVFFSHDTRLGRDVVIEPNVVFGPGVSVADNVAIRAFSHLEGANVAEGAIVGPYARLRPGADVGEGAHVGNFVELKNARLGPGAKANHLTYLGDAEIGAKANIGAGTITCNYDGVNKHKTTIGAGAFIGSNSALVAPVTVGAGAIVGAGSVITHEVPDDALAVARGEQKTMPGLAARLRARYQAMKAAKKGA